MSYYNIKSLRMIIEFLYLNFKSSIFVLLLPCYICNQVLFIVVALVNERLRDNFKFDRVRDIVSCDEVSDYWLRTLIGCLICNFFFVLAQACINYFMFRMMGFEYLKRIWSWVDTTLLVIKLAVLAQFMSVMPNFDGTTFVMEYNAYKRHAQGLRILFMVGQVLLFSKSQQFLTMVDQIAPLISIALKIMNDIMGFIAILLIIGFTFSFAFYLLA